MSAFFLATVLMFHVSHLMLFKWLAEAVLTVTAVIIIYLLSGVFISMEFVLRKTDLRRL